MENFHKVIIIGAGPIGLYFAQKCESEGLDYLVLEGTDTFGGQISHLYPEKEITDVPGFDSVKAITFVNNLYALLNKNRVVFNARVTDIKKGEKVAVFVGKTKYFCEKLVIATGLGASTPRPLGVEHENECDNIIYSIKSYSHLKNKRVAIFGGGDSALDWAKEISAISDNVHLIHRRMEFRGNPETIKDCKNLNVHLPFVPHSIDVENGKATSVTIKKVDSDELLTIPVDYIFVNYGNIATQMSFPFEMENAFLKVKFNFSVDRNIFAIGDVCQYENKTRRIAPGLKEADKVFSMIIC